MPQGGVEHVVQRGECQKILLKGLLRQNFEDEKELAKELGPRKSIPGRKQGGVHARNVKLFCLADTWSMHGKWGDTGKGLWQSACHEESRVY